VRGVRFFSYFLAPRLFFLKEWFMKKVSQMFSWEFIFVFFISAMVLSLMAGCATYVSTSVGDHTVRTGFHLTHEVAEDD
tara:strand:- start:1221 stop:1457 length:237 start_codon:yes stop_codon:yes gene_type:complete